MDTGRGHHGLLPRRGFSFTFLASICVVASLSPLTAGTSAALPTGNGVAWEWEIAPLSGDRYQLNVTVTNLGPQKDAIFFWTLGGVSSHWETVSSDPKEWDFSHPGPTLHFRTGNGSYPTDGYYRIFGQPGAPSPCLGWTSVTFTWTFKNQGGPDPLSFAPADFLFHLQTIGTEWQNDGPSYTFPGSSATQPGTWGAVKSLYR